MKVKALIEKTDNGFNMWKRSAYSYHCRRKKRGKKRHHNGIETKVRFCCLDFTLTGRKKLYTG